MSQSTKPSWERFGDAMLDWGGYVLLAFATFLGVSAGDPDPAWQADDPAHRGRRRRLDVRAATRRRPLPNIDHRLRLDVFFVGLLVFASVLMLRQPLFFIFMIAGFFYATILRPLPLAVVGVAATLDPRQHPDRRLPADRRGVDVLPRDHRRPDDRDQRRRGLRREGHRAERGTPRQALARLEAALEENAGLHAQLLTQAREAGVLDERQRMAREIHDTIAQGLTGIITQLEAADQARDRPADRDRHLENAKRLARESLTEARRSVEASMPAALESRDAAGRARRSSPASGPSSTASPSRSTITGEVIALHPEIEVALLRTAQEALDQRRASTPAPPAPG